MFFQFLIRKRICDENPRPEVWVGSPFIFCVFLYLPGAASESTNAHRRDRSTLRFASTLGAVRDDPLLACGEFLMQLVHHESGLGSPKGRDSCSLSLSFYSCSTLGAPGGHVLFRGDGDRPLDGLDQRELFGRF